LCSMQSSRIESIFSTLRAKREAALVAFLVAGDPDLARSYDALSAVCAGGADIIELGLPFSDPLADGKVIQEGCQRALATGTTPTDVLDLVRGLRRQYDTGIILFSCYNLILQYGLQAFADDAVTAGADGVLVTDLPPEEGRTWWDTAHLAGLATILLVAPTSQPERISQIAAVSSGFVYCVSRMGVTGAQQELPPDLPDIVARIRAATNLSICVGFGIATPQQVRQVCTIAAGAVVGSALVDKAHTSSPQELTEFVRSLKNATKLSG
jgi:tryptophan synthase alpha chain